MDYFSEKGNFLVKILKYLLSDKVLTEADTEINEEFYSFCRHHKVTNMVYPVIKNLEIPEEVNNRFFEDYQRAIQREAMQEVFSGVLFSCFEKECISYLPVKGILIKKLYPKEYLRSSNDTDILIKDEDYLKAQSVMDNLGYIKNDCDNEDNDYHIEYHKKSVSIELHKSLAPLNSTHYEYFKNTFEKANSTGYRYSMTDEDFYIYVLYHLYKHFIKGGVGVRYFLDMHLINEKMTLDREYIAKELDKIGLKNFDTTVKELSAVFFGEKEMDERLKAIADFVYKSGAHGEKSFYTAAKFTGAGTDKNNYTLNKMKYFKEAWFIGRKGMSEKYSVLNKHKWLLPFCYIHKGFYTLFKKPEAIKREKDNLQKYNKDLTSYVEKINKLAGL